MNQVSKYQKTIKKDENEDVKTRPKKKEKNVFTYMESTIQNKTPKSILYESITQNRKIKVWTRSHSYVRSICTGYLIAFDRYWNLAMMDVDETYKLPLIKQNQFNDLIEDDKENIENTADSSKNGSDSVKQSFIKRPLIYSCEVPEKLPFKLLSKELNVPFNSNASPCMINKLQEFKSKGYQLCYRHINQLLIRGDNVVMVTFAD